MKYRVLEKNYKFHLQRIENFIHEDHRKNSWAVNVVRDWSRATGESIRGADRHTRESVHPASNAHSRYRELLPC